MPKAPVLSPEEWADWPDEKLLDLRMCQLGVNIEAGVLADRIATLHGELEGRGLVHFKPHFWLSDEWFSPDGVPGVAIPFYLAHPRLERLERTYMLEVAGGTPPWGPRVPPAGGVHAHPRAGAGAGDGQPLQAAPAPPAAAGLRAVLQGVSAVLRSQAVQQ